MWRALFALCVALSGCAAVADMDSPAYGAGYSDGCAASQSGLRASVSEATERRQPGYRAGYSSGRALCGRADPSGTLPGR